MRGNCTSTLWSFQSGATIEKSTFTSGNVECRGPLLPQSLGLFVTLMLMLADSSLRTGWVELCECDLCLPRAGHAAARPPLSYTSYSLGVLLLHSLRSKGQFTCDLNYLRAVGLQLDSDTKTTKPPRCTVVRSLKPLPKVVWDTSDTDLEV